MSNFLTRFTLVVALLGFFLTRVSMANAGSVLVDSQGFEAPAYSAGSLTGQPNSSPAAAQWKYSGSGNSSASIQPNIKRSGSQALQVNRAALDDSRWAIPVSPVSTSGLVVVAWDQYVVDTGPSAGLGPFLGVEAYDGNVALLLNPGLIGSVGVDSTTGDILYQETVSGILVDSNIDVTFDTWHEFRLAMDFGNRAYQVFFDGAEIVNEPFVDGWVDEFTDADISALAAGFDSGSQNANGSAVFDNFAVVEFARLAGDYDVDGDVDQDDYATWKASFGSSVTQAGTGSDGNGNGFVDAADYTIWRDNLGAVAVATVAAQAVPEPSSLLLVALLAFSASCSRRLR